MERVAGAILRRGLHFEDISHLHDAPWSAGELKPGGSVDASCGLDGDGINGLFIW